MNQIFSNLLDNAIKFTPRGRVELTLHTEQNGDVLFTIKDSGIGIAEEYLPHLFEPFSQEEQNYTRRFEGNGLGLALVKKYCELNKATISCDSKKGEGSVFHVLFPGPSQNR